MTFQSRHNQSSCQNDKCSPVQKLNCIQGVQTYFLIVVDFFFIYSLLLCPKNVANMSEICRQVSSASRMGKDSNKACVV